MQALSSVANNKESLVILIVVLAVGLSFAIYIYNFNQYSLLYFGDAVSHLVKARIFADSINPGLFEQMGTVWLPLPHLILLPVSLIDPLFITGFAGLAISLPSLAITSAIMYKIIRIQIGEGEGVSYIAIAGALLYASNPNILYLGTTAMTEAPLMLFFVTSVYYFQKWLIVSSSFVEPKNEEGRENWVSKKNGSLLKYQISQPRNPLYDLIKCSTFISMATLCRYEVWIIPPFLIIFVFLFIICKKSRRGFYYSLKRKTASCNNFSPFIFWHNPMADVECILL